MKLITRNKEKLLEIKGLLSGLPGELYTQPEPVLSDATIGQHFRHILEFYICLMKGTTKGKISYDERERNPLIETRINYASKVIDEIVKFLDTINEDKDIILKASYSSVSNDSEEIRSSLQRELAYALDHTVHHLALIKIALVEENVKVDESFGVAPSTLRYRHYVNKDQFN